MVWFLMQNHISKMAFENVNDELRSKFRTASAQSKISGSAPGSLPVNMSGRLFSPRDGSLDHNEKRRMKKRIYTETRLVKKNIVFLRSSQLKIDHTVCLPVGMALKKLTEAGQVVKLSCSRLWDAQATRVQIQKVAPFDGFHFLQPLSQTPRFLHFCKDLAINEIMKLSGSTNLYVLQVGRISILLHNITDVKFTSRIAK